MKYVVRKVSVEFTLHSANSNKIERHCSRRLIVATRQEKSLPARYKDRLIWDIKRQSVFGNFDGLRIRVV